MSQFVEARELNIGYRYDEVFDTSSQTHKQVKVPCNFMFVSIIDTLKSLLSHDAVINLINSEDNSQEYILEDISDGEYFLNHPLFKKYKNALRIEIYFDEFETVNCIGYRTKINKRDAIYFKLRNFSAFFESKLENIFLVSLFNVIDLEQ